MVAGPAGTDGDIEAGKLYYLDSSQQWEETDADAASTATGMIAIAVVDDEPKISCKRDWQDTEALLGFTTGDVLYVSGTAGEITKTAPTGSADIVRIVKVTVQMVARGRYTLIRQKTGIELS